MLNLRLLARAFSTRAAKSAALPVKRVAVTGAAGQVAYSILFRIASYEIVHNP